MQGTVDVNADVVKDTA